MKASRILRLRQKTEALQATHKSLLEQQDRLISTRMFATSEDAKMAASRDAATIFSRISRLERSLHIHRRLLARTQGDEFSFQDSRT